MVQPKNIQCTVFTAIYRLSTYKITSFQTLSLGYILKIFLKFHKFEPQYSYKICSHRKKKSVFCLETGVVFEKTTRVYERSLRKHPFLLTLRPWGFSIPHDSK